MRRRALIAAIVVALAGVVFAVDPNGLRHAWRLQADVERLDLDNRRLREANDILRMELRRLADDPAALERAAREELGLVQPGDIVFQLEERYEAGDP